MLYFFQLKEKIMLFFRIIILLIFTFASGKILSTEIKQLRFITEPSGVVMYDEKNENLEGIVGERIKLLIKKIGLTNKVEILPWSRAYYEAIKNKNAVIFPIVKTKEREKELNFCCVIYKSRQFFFKLKDRKGIIIQKVEDAKKYSVGVVREDYRHDALKKAGFSNFEIATSMELNFKKFVGKREDLILLSEMSMNKYLSQNNMSINDVEKLLEFKELDINSYIAFNKEIEDSIIAILKKALKNGYDP